MAASHFFYRPTPHFVVEAVERCGPNVMVFQVAKRERRWNIVGAYVAPEDKVTMETVIAAIGRKPPGVDLMVAGDFNVDILAPEGRRAENIATDLATAGVEDMAQHFMPRRRRWSRDRRTWDMRQKGQVVRSRNDYILGTDRRLFKNVAVRDPWNNTDHNMVLGSFTGCTPGGDTAVSGGTEAMAGVATGGAITDGHTLCGSTESRTKTSAAGSETKRFDLGGNVAAHQRESRHAPGPVVREGG